MLCRRPVEGRNEERQSSLILEKNAREAKLLRVTALAWSILVFVVGVSACSLFAVLLSGGCARSARVNVWTASTARGGPLITANILTSA